MSDGFRNLTEAELILLKRLLEAPMDDDEREKLMGQLADCLVREVQEYNDNYGSIEFECARPLGEHYTVAEAHGKDSDGADVYILLCVSNGELHEMEVVRADGRPLLNMPSAEDFDVTEYRP